MTAAPGVAQAVGRNARYEAVRAVAGQTGPVSEMLALEVDAAGLVGRASGTLRTAAGSVAWSAPLTNGPPGIWTGSIDPTADPAFPWALVEVKASGSLLSATFKAAQAAGTQVQEFRRSGRYESLPALPLGAAPIGTFMLDVENDGPPRASGVMPAALLGAASDLHWFADLVPGAANTWTGTNIHLHEPPPNLGFRLSGVSVDATGATVKVEFSDGAQTRAQEFVRRGPFREVEVEFDCTSDAEVVDTLDTTGLPPVPGAPPSPITISEVFERAGCRLTRMSAAGPPLNMNQPNEAEADPVWEDNELRDAISQHWAYAQTNGINRGAWALWVLFAKKYRKEGVAGLMFDCEDGNQRQGAVVFAESALYQESGVHARGVALRRYQFWCAVHEIGHCFNLPHAVHAASESPLWLPRADEPSFATFMNYPWPADPHQGVPGYFSEFQYRFSNDELRFLHHAPEHLVKMGEAPFGAGAAGGNAAAIAGALRLDIRLHRHEGPAGIKQLDFLEPLVLELKLKNQSAETIHVPRGALSDARVVVRVNGEQRRYRPYSRECGHSRSEPLLPGRSFYEQIFPAAGVRSGRWRWLVDQPGTYEVEAEVRVHGQSLRATMPFEVLPPAPGQEELAKTFFTDDVARFLAFDGSNLPCGATTALQELIERLPRSRAAAHARIALASLRRRGTKVLDFERRRVVWTPARFQEADRLFREALTADTPSTLGHLDYEEYAMQHATMLRLFEGPSPALEAWANAERVMEAAALPSSLPGGVREKWAAFRTSLGGPPLTQPGVKPSRVARWGLLGLTAAGGTVVGLLARESEVRSLRNKTDVLIRESQRRAEDQAAIIAELEKEVKKLREGPPPGPIDPGKTGERGPDMHPPPGISGDLVKHDGQDEPTEPVAKKDLQGLRVMPRMDLMVEHKKRVDMVETLRRRRGVPIHELWLAEEAAKRAARVLREKQPADPPPK